VAQDAGACGAPGLDIKVIRYTMATHLRAENVPEAERYRGFLGHRAYSGKTEVYARYRPDYLGQAVAAIDEYMASLRVSRELESKKATGKSGLSA
jgi:hypothetical protein